MTSTDVSYCKALPSLLTPSVHAVPRGKGLSGVGIAHNSNLSALGLRASQNVRRAAGDRKTGRENDIHTSLSAQHDIAPQR